MEVENRIKKHIQSKLLSFKSDMYNENTYSFSQGYKRCLQDLITEFDKITEEK